MNDRILLFIPCYNCRDQISRVANQICLPDAPRVSQVMVIDNQSSDRTPDAAAAALSSQNHTPWLVCRNHGNYGLGGSHKVAFEYAMTNGFSHVIILHGDDQAHLADLRLPLENDLHNDYDSVLGARFMPGAVRSGYSALRTIGNFALNAACGLITRSWIFDQGSGLNVYKTDYLRSRFYLGFDDSLIFPNMMFFYSVWTRSPYRFVPISWREEDQTSNAKAFSQAVKVLRLAIAGLGKLPAPEHLSTFGPYGFDIVYSGAT